MKHKFKTGAVLLVVLACLVIISSSTTYYINAYTEITKHMRISEFNYQIIKTLLS
jgi:hypothetical protein